MITIFLCCMSHVLMTDPQIRRTHAVIVGDACCQVPISLTVSSVVYLEVEMGRGKPWEGHEFSCPRTFRSWKLQKDGLHPALNLMRPFLTNSDVWMKVKRQLESLAADYPTE